MWIIAKLDLKDNDISIVGSYKSIIEAKSKFHDLNEEDQVSYRDNKKKFIKVYKKNSWLWGETAVYIYKLLQVPDIADKIVRLK